jgi:hypothetical protein
MVMQKLLLNKVKAETKNWVRRARLHSARMQADVRFGVGISRPRGCMALPRQRLRAAPDRPER